MYQCNFTPTHFPVLTSCAASVQHQDPPASACDESFQVDASAVVAQALLATYAWALSQRFHQAVEPKWKGPPPPSPTTRPLVVVSLTSHGSTCSGNSRKRSCIQERKRDGAWGQGMTQRDPEGPGRAVFSVLDLLEGTALEVGVFPGLDLVIHCLCT